MFPQRDKILKLGEPYWLLEQKPRTKTRGNVCIMTLVRRIPRQIVGHAVSRGKTAKTIQRMVDAAVEAQASCADGYFGYLIAPFPFLISFNCTLGHSPARITS